MTDAQLTKIVDLYVDLLTTDRADTAEINDLDRRIAAAKLDNGTLAFCKRMAEARIRSRAHLDSITR